MGHQHHNHSTPSTSTTRLFFTMALNFVITAVEIIGGIFSGSLSLISDALHNFSDGIAIFISYIAVRLSKQAKTKHHTFGMKRAEILAAIINSATLIAICVYLIKESYGRFVHPEPIAAQVMIGVASIGLLANIIGTLLLRKGSQSNMNIRSVYLHLFSDAISSVAVIIGGIAIYFFEVYWVDPLLTVIISIYILKESFKIVRAAITVLMMATPGSISLDVIKKEIEYIQGIKNIHHVHVWMLDEQNIHFEAHVDVDDMQISECTGLCEQIENKLHQLFDISHVTLQFESNKCCSKNLL